MPALGESVTEGTVTRWLKKEGETVEVDEPLLEVSTDKVDTEIPSPAAGVVLSITVGEDETVEVGAQLAVIGGPGEAPAPAAAPQAAPAQAPAQAPAPAPAAQPTPEPAAAPAAAQPPAAAPAGPVSGTPVVLPALGESVTEGTVTRWLKSVGDTVEADEPLLEVSTDKVDTEIPSPAAGVIVAINVAEDETVEVGTTLAVIGAPGSAPAPAAAPAAPAPEAAPQPAQPAAQVAPEPAPAAVPAPTPPSPTPAAPNAAPAAAAPAPAPQQAPAATQAPQAPRQTQPAPVAIVPTPPQAQPSAPAPAADDEGPGAYVTPLVRKLAAERGVDLTTVNGTGVGGRIRKQDVIEAAKALAPAPAPAAAAAPVDAAAPSAPAAISPLRGRTEKMSRLRTVIAKRMVESLQVSAQLTTVVEVDVTPIARLRDRAKKDFEAREGVKLSFLPFFAMATVEALKQYPQVNASIDMEAGTVTYHGSENLGIAVDTERGLLVPVIKNAGDLNLGGIARAIADLAARTRANKVSPDELGGGTFTLTNTGSRGALFDTPIINQPQVGILGTGAVVKRPSVVTDAVLGEVIAVRSIVYLALSYDHRLVDGADAARFLSTIKARLEEGRFESELGL
jgi:2-oxoglutarate dehydrogenase E2 component (dihydrolipoamide succinyltransferase)